ncbi:PNS1-like protein [Achlya hypogyna]|uniref:Choline transporter-like protein n=1 Tax=Achlya hypogyna TaxID=1202772 RepID=A0A1V9Y6A5_ACHHY|nr:PNS1-like protein [Achlya hypogyna]
MSYGAPIVSEQTPLNNTMAKADSCDENKCDLKEERRCNDVLFAIAYLLAFGGVLVIFAMFSGEALEYAGDQLEQKHHKYKYALRIAAAIAGGSVVLSLVWTGIMLVMGKLLIWIAAITAIVGTFVAGILGTKFLYDNGDDTFYWCPAALGSLISILITIYVCCIRRRIAFASANLKVSCSAVLRYPVILAIAFAATIAQMAWALLWSVATYAAMNHGEYVSADGKGYNNAQKFGIFVLMLLAFFWTLFVIKNVVHVTTAGTVASWWYNADNERKSMTSTTALCHAMTLSFGSICFGSLVVSIIETIKTILEVFRQLASQSGNSVAVCLLGCLECIIGCISRIVQYFNKYAYSYVGIYGFSFIRAGKETYELFEKMGWSAVANDSLVDNVLLIGSAMVGLASAAAAYGVVTWDIKSNNELYTQNLSNPAVLPVTGLLIGFSICYIIMAVINSSVATVFVLFAEDPHSLHHSHPELHDTLHEAWNEIYPEEYAKNPHGTKKDASKA